MKIDLFSSSNDYTGSIELLECMGSDIDVVNAARVSFNKESKELAEKDSKLIKYLWDNKHTSPFEHCILKFRIEAPLFIARQHMRHRTWSYNEVSRRYTAEDIKVYSPSKLRQQAESNRQASTEELIDPVVRSVSGGSTDYQLTASQAISYVQTEAINLYNKLLKLGVCREQARGILPQNMFTSYIATANLLNVLKFLGLRNKPEAQYEMRLLAEAMEQLVSTKFPEVYKAYTERQV